MKHETIYNLEGADILAFGLNEELVLIGAGDALKDEAIKYATFQSVDEDGQYATYDEGASNEYIKMNLYSFAEAWIKEGRPTQTQTQYYNN